MTLVLHCSWLSYFLVPGKFTSSKDGSTGSVWSVSHHFVSSPFSLPSDDNVAQVNQVNAYPVMSNSFATPWSVALQAPLSTGFPREEYWSGLPLPPPGDLPNPGIERVSLVSPTLQADSLLLEPLRKPSASHQMSQIHVCSGPYLQCSESTFASSEYNYVLMPASALSKRICIMVPIICPCPEAVAVWTLQGGPREGTQPVSTEPPVFTWV